MINNRQGDVEVKNTDAINIETAWNLKVEAHNNIFDFLEKKGLNNGDLLKFRELLKECSCREVELSLLYEEI
ncbi:hypothetical protein [Clostridium sp. CF012]|uniref:hypothetical protein n=1 Tax=Clostridium sp. CF012 TaxID=2843319 RepID=UPI001C0E095E|nr:hypothetical protein [Clostridium sp. CF012]MBU3145592.1 hypothetical protein [Clostridium sp. CF012]